MSTVAELNPVSNVPKLEVDGTNWVMFSTRLRIALTDKDVYGQLDGTSMKPNQTVDPNDYAKFSLLILPRNGGPRLLMNLPLKVVTLWLRCELDKLRAKYEDLIRVGVTVPQDQWATRIIGSLPENYQKHLATIEAAARAASLATAKPATGAAPTTTFSVSPDLLMSLAIEEYDRIAAGGTTRGKGKDDTGVALFAANSGSNRNQSSANRGRGKPNKSNDSKPRGVCWNCGGKGHVKSKCPSPDMSGGESAAKGKDKDNKKEGSSGTANAAIDEEDGVWSVFEAVDLLNAPSETESVSSWDYVHSSSSVSSFEPDDDQGSMPDLIALSDSDSESDGSDESSEWLSEVGDEESSEASARLLLRLAPVLSSMIPVPLSIFHHTAISSCLTMIFPHDHSQQQISRVSMLRGSIFTGDWVYINLGGPSG